VQIITKTNSSLALTPAAAPQQPNPDLTLAPNSVQGPAAQTNPPSAETPAVAGLSAGAIAAADETASLAVPAADAAAAKGALSGLLPAPMIVAARELDLGARSAMAKPRATGGAVEVPSQPGLGAGVLLTFGSVLMAATLFLVLVALRRFRPAANGSLISQSMERR